MGTTRSWNNLSQVRLKPEIRKSNKLKVFGSNVTQGPQPDSQSRLRSPMTEEEEH